ncbi:MAG: short-chain dehydrogenase, partial [Rhodospirillales bacterium]|nr:short-chain dehydrogenase [Rhodospirillales bacterium]
DGVRVTALCPGYVATDMVAKVDDPPAEAMIQPADLAELVATVLALPNTASIAELPVNCRLEDTV